MKVDGVGSETHSHQPICYAWKLTSTIKDETTNTKVYTGLDCAKVFVNDMLQLYEGVSHYFSMNEPINMTKQEQNKFEKATNCHICGKIFADGVKRARDHNHVNG